jgi:hypothetical protein
MPTLASIELIGGLLVIATCSMALTHDVETGVTASLPHIVVSETMLPRGEIGATYFEALPQSQVWMNIEPASTPAVPEDRPKLQALIGDTTVPASIRLLVSILRDFAHASSSPQRIHRN